MKRAGYFVAVIPHLARPQPDSNLQKVLGVGLPLQPSERDERRALSTTATTLTMRKIYRSQEMPKKNTRTLAMPIAAPAMAPVQDIDTLAPYSENLSIGKLWGQPFRAAAGLSPGAPRAQRTLAVHHKIGAVVVAI